MNVAVEYTSRVIGAGFGRLVLSQILQMLVVVGW